MLDFWRWALATCGLDNARGYLAEYLVARALGATNPHRIEWGGHDVVAPDGTRIEVKASGYLQSWVQLAPSTPVFQFKSAYTATAWDPVSAGNVPVDVEQRVHAWVFALQTCSKHESYDPLDIGQWEFRVVPHRQLVRTGQKSARLSFFDRLGVAPVGWEELPQAVAAARGEHERLGATPP